jgi:hypothetical protein
VSSNPRFLDGHPTVRAFSERLMQKPVPASYGQASYHPEHAFLFTAADGGSRFGRYRSMPEAGEADLSPDEASQQSANFLRQELESRLRNGPVLFRHCQLKETVLKTIPLSLGFLTCMRPCIPLLAKKVLVRVLSLPPGAEISALLALS